MQFHVDSGWSVKVDMKVSMAVLLGGGKVGKRNRRSPTYKRPIRFNAPQNKSEKMLSRYTDRCC